METRERRARLPTPHPTVYRTAPPLRLASLDGGLSASLRTCGASGPAGTVLWTRSCSLKDRFTVCSLHQALLPCNNSPRYIEAPHAHRSGLAPHSRRQQLQGRAEGSLLLVSSARRKHMKPFGVLLALTLASAGPGDCAAAPAVRGATARQHRHAGGLPPLPHGALRWRPQGVAWMRQARRLHQLLPPGGSNRPCVDATEHTCRGAGTDLCCNKGLFRCGTRLDTGGPRCAMCPQVCIMDCMPGYKCGRDANGCFNCLPDSSGGGGGFVRECDDSKPCATGKVCQNNTCRTDPCSTTRCGGATPKCVVTAALSASCVEAASDQPASTKCKPACGNGFACQQRPSTATTPATWQCVRRRGSVKRPQRKTASAVAASSMAKAASTAGTGGTLPQPMRRAARPRAAAAATGVAASTSGGGRRMLLGSEVPLAGTVICSS